MTSDDLVIKLFIVFVNLEVWNCTAHMKSTTEDFSKLVNNYSKYKKNRFSGRDSEHKNNKELL